MGSSCPFLIKSPLFLKNIKLRMTEELTMNRYNLITNKILHSNYLGLLARFLTSNQLFMEEFHLVFGFSGNI
jgi:hypothetical protein